jgi:hypothetical protein
LITCPPLFSCSEIRSSSQQHAHAPCLATELVLFLFLPADQMSDLACSRNSAWLSQLFTFLFFFFSSPAASLSPGDRLPLPPSLFRLSFPLLPFSSFDWSKADASPLLAPFLTIVHLSFCRCAARCSVRISTCAVCMCVYMYVCLCFVIIYYLFIRGVSFGQGELS